MESFLEVFVTKFRNLYFNLKSSLWFYPGIIVLLFSIAALILIEIDAAYSQSISEYKFFNSNAEGARGILATIAASMITVAGVVFSITIVALSLTSSQYSSRVLRNFMRDHKNQLVLGVFVGIFAYCLLVLRTIGGEEEKTFIPHLSVFFSVILSFAGIGIFVFFIHHIASSIQASQIISNIYDETIQVIQKLFPDRIKSDDKEQNHVEKEWIEAEGFYPIFSSHTGYIQKIDINTLKKIAVQYHIIIRIEKPVGSFIINDFPFFSIKGIERPDNKIVNIVKSAFTIERQRTIEQDPSYGIRQIVDVALKALSPGINDTTTAVISIERLTAIMCRLAERRITDCLITEQKEVRVIINQHDFAFYMDESFNQIRQHGKTNLVILEKLSWAFKTINSSLITKTRKEITEKHMEALFETIDLNVSAGNEKDVLVKKCNVYLPGYKSVSKKNND